MAMLNLDNWKSVELDALMDDVIEAVESGEIDRAFDQAALTPGKLSRAKTTRNLSKNYLMACLRAGLDGVSEAEGVTALCLVNAFRSMNAEAPLDELPQGYKVYSIKIPHSEGNPDVEIYVIQGHRILYGEKIFPRGVLTEHFLQVTEA